MCTWAAIPCGVRDAHTEPTFYPECGAASELDTLDFGCHPGQLLEIKVEIPTDTGDTSHVRIPAWTRIKWR